MKISEIITRITTIKNCIEINSKSKNYFFSERDVEAMNETIKILKDKKDEIISAINLNDIKDKE